MPLCRPIERFRNKTWDSCFPSQMWLAILTNLFVLTLHLFLLRSRRSKSHKFQKVITGELSCCCTDQQGKIEATSKPWWRVVIIQESLHSLIKLNCRMIRINLVTFPWFKKKNIQIQADLSGESKNPAGQQKSLHSQNKQFLHQNHGLDTNHN